MKDVKVINPTIIDKSNNVLRVAAYCRVSTDSKDQINSFLTQVKYYNDFIKRNNKMILVDIYADEGITGTDVNKRDEFKRMMSDCKAGKVDRILVKSVSRFARNALECIDSVRTLKKFGTSVFFENDNIDTDKMNSEMILYIKSAFAQSEALAGSKRVSVAFRMKMEKGEFKIGNAPYGYEIIEGKLQPKIELVPIIERIFSEYLSGTGMGRIAEKLNEERLTDRVWNYPAIKYILKNEKYVGDSLWQKYYTPEVLPFKKKRNYGQADKYYATNTHQGIISKEVFDAVQKKLAAGYERKKNVVKTAKTVFDGKIFCGECGWSYKKKFQSDELYWGCSHDGLSGMRCSAPNIKIETLEMLFVRAYNKLRLYESEIIDKALSQLVIIKAGITSQNDEIKEIDKEVARLSEQNSMYNDLKKRNIVDDTSYYENTSRIKQRLYELREKRMKLLSLDEEERCIENLRRFKATLVKQPKALFVFDCEIFKNIVNKVLVYDDRVVFVFVSDVELGVKI